MAAMGHPGGARNPVDPRFLSLFNVFEIEFPCFDSLSRIYNSILEENVLKNVPSEDIRKSVSILSYTHTHTHKRAFLMHTLGEQLTFTILIETLFSPCYCECAQ